MDRTKQLTIQVQGNTKEVDKFLLMCQKFRDLCIKGPRAFLNEPMKVVVSRPTRLTLNILNGPYLDALPETPEEEQYHAEIWFDGC